MTDHSVSVSPQDRAADGLRDGLRLHHTQQLEAAAGGLRATLDEARSAPYEIEFETRVRLGLGLADVLIDRGELSEARTVLKQELEFADSIVQWISAMGDPDQQRAARQGRSQIQDRSAQAALIGQPAPELAVREWVLGEPVSISALKGRPLLLEFWATWCAPCVQAFQKLRELQQTHGESRLAVVALTRLYSSASGDANAQRSEIETVRGFVEGRGLDFSIGVEDGDQAHHLYGATGLPTVALIDRRGSVVSVHRGADDPRLATTLQKVIDEAGAEGTDRGS